MSETSFCEHCKRHVPAVSFTLHTAHCERFMQVCSKCQEPVPKADIEQHNLDTHVLIPCKACQQQVEKGHHDNHVANDCPKRLMSCEYCEIQVPASGLENHEFICGSRTEMCEICGNHILIRMMKDHESLHKNSPPKNSSWSRNSVQEQVIKGSDQVKPSSSKMNAQPEILPKFRNVVCQNIFQASALVPETQTTNNHKAEKDCNLSVANKLPMQDHLGEEILHIPCEFCATPCTLRNLEEHQQLCSLKVGTCSYCRANVLGQSSAHTCARHGANKISNQDENYWSSYGDALPKLEDAFDEPSMPCDNCGALFPVSCLELHEVGCKFSEQSTEVHHGHKYEVEKINQPEQLQEESEYWSGYAFGGSDDCDEEASIPCEICGTLFPFSCIKLHEVACSSKEQNATEQLYRQNQQRFEYSENILDTPNFGLDQEVSIPCDTCKKPFPFTEIQLHEVSCRFTGMTKLDDGKQDVNDKAHLNDFQASRAPLPPFLPCSFCNIVVPSSNFELHEAACSSRLYEEKPKIPKKTQPQKPIVTNTRTENAKQRELRQNTLSATENRLQTAPKIQQSQYAVVRLPDGREILKKRNPSDDNVDIGNVLGHGQVYESTLDGPVMNQTFYPRMNKDQASLDYNDKHHYHGKMESQQRDLKNLSVPKNRTYDGFVSGNQKKSDFQAKDNTRKSEETRVVKKPHSSFANYAYKPDPGNKLGSGENQQTARLNANNGAVPRTRVQLVNRPTNTTSQQRDIQRNTDDRKNDDSLGARPKRP